MIFFVSFVLYINVNAQNIYKTPSGERYHLSSCRMVENVSKKLLGNEDISKYRLTPCKICKPPSINNYVSSYNASNKAVGTSSSVRCKGYTQKGTRCKHKTKLANGYCYQHTKQNSSSKRKHSGYSKTTTSTCGARTKSGGYCKRKVKGGGRCYQH
ncbi:hypothetical protein C1H87_11165 [Flavivirga eckloniae]|uniref:Uncharacterized protein n=2 Tax=Flavivirga eckloniae TaxID=1803846 RepID=A0A2K9PQ82_9FLAO|nr:hypothetical protein C1H87_11165 [Flavivirga eckloniae]